MKNPNLSIREICETIQVSKATHRYLARISQHHKVKKLTYTEKSLFSRVAPNFALVAVPPSS
jgi:hypothetical protein